MQSKMASRSAGLNRAYQALFRAWVPLFQLGARYAPRAVLYPIGDLIMASFLALNPKYARAVRSNFAGILDLPDEAPRVRGLARRMARNHGRYWIDFFHWSERGRDAALGSVGEVRNGEALEQCARRGRGTIVLTAHVGNWEMGGLLLRTQATKIAVVYVPDRFAALEDHRSAYRRKAGLEEIRMTGDPLSALAALRVLRDAGVVALQGDRDFNNSGIALPFFGRSAYFPSGPAMLSLLSGAPILPVYIVRAGRDAPRDAEFEIIFHDPIVPEGSARSEADVARIVSRYAASVESIVREFPDQWYCFYPFWNDPSRRSSPTA